MIGIKECVSNTIRLNKKRKQAAISRKHNRECRLLTLGIK